MENIYSVLLTAVTVMGGSAAWRYYEKRAAKKEDDDRFIRNDCTSPIWAGLSPKPVADLLPKPMQLPLHGK